MKKVAGGYILVLEVDSPVNIQVGKRGEMPMNPGRYLYGGSAKCGIAHRINRHFFGGENLHWHIDYLTHHPQVDVVEAWCYPDYPEVEHQLAAKDDLSDDEIFRGFGNGDCGRGCQSHLWKIKGKISAADFSEDYYIVTHAQQYSNS
ncbi:MAG: hypothetical protein MAGBODY4_00860 [Candidatus Marinimicrobia bacterium]|nr:hypothetical protein [Candidatus Neomarinimicrobiota bacterium]